MLNRAKHPSGKLGKAIAKSDVVDARRKYITHRCGARSRGIEFLLTFEEWMEIWARSGKWRKRGRGSKQYCMSRNGDTGPYAANNVKIKTNQENICEGAELLRRSRRTAAIMQICRMSIGVLAKVRAKRYKVREISAATGVSQATISKIGQDGFYFSDEIAAKVIDGCKTLIRAKHKL